MRLTGLDRDEPSPDPWEGAATLAYRQLEDRGAQREQVKMSGKSLREWVDLVPEARGPLDFRRFAFQEELYGEQAADDREQVFEKATQVGVSTQAIRIALFHADVHQRSVLYTFPTTDELADFSRKRIRPVIRASRHLLARMTGDGVDNVGQKQIGFDGWVIFRGTNKPIDSLDIDVAIFDEYDTSDQANIEASERRVTGPQSAGLIRRVGVPSIPGFGIDALYEASDRRAWTVRCDACNHWNPMRGWEAFHHNVDQDALALVCKACRRPIDVRVGEWVAEHPDRPVRGYHIPKLLIPGRRTLEQLVANSKKTRPDQVEAFHTRDLGEAYAPAEGRLSLEAVRACVRPEIRLQESLVSMSLVTMGIDMASARALNVTIEQSIDMYRGRKVWIGTVDDEPGRTAFQRLCWLMDAFGVNMAGIDNEPDGRFAMAFAERFPGRVYRCDFFSPQPGARKESDLWNVDDDSQFVSLWRTKTYDATFERYRLQQVLLPPLDLIPPEFPEHLGNLYRRKVELPGNTGKMRVDYVRTGPEDYAQCEAYNLAAIELFHRNAGLSAARGQGPVPLADQIEDFAALDLSSYGDGGEYRPGFDD